MYIQPKSEIAQVEAMTIMGFSTDKGQGGTETFGGGPVVGDAPKRRTPVF